ncbi:chymotrypsin family serine protease [Streptosporangium saharense]|uniref:hypothetical protein n=1 Tax=Streptosporangium saharense TaxID=1706840 RepID=UPI0036A255A5
MAVLAFGVVTVPNLVGGAASAAPAPTPTSAAESGPVPTPAAERMRVALAGQAEKDRLAEAKERWKRENGVIGMSADSAGHVTAAVSRTAPADRLAEVRATVNARRLSPDGAPVTVTRSTLTSADIEATAATIIAFHAEHPEYGISFSFDAARDATVVSGNLPAVLAEKLEAKAGKVILEMSPETLMEENVGTSSLGALEGVGRVQDRGPWHFGGARISSHDGTVCSSGFSMDASPGYDATYSTTASHCGPLNTNWLSGGYEYGTVIWRVDFPATDVMKLACCSEHYGDRIWTSPTTTRKVSWAWDPGLGYNTPAGGSGICVSGGKSGNEECFARVTNTDATVCFSGQSACTQHLMAYERDNGSQMTWGGDSGSPVYTIDNGNVDAHGTHVGFERRSYGGGAAKYLHYAMKYSTIRHYYGGVIRNW